MIIEIIQQLFTRDLERLYKEISLYKDENKLWVTDKAIANSAGNLCLHLVGNLNTYIGTEIGKTGYIRNRDLEFSAKGMPQAELLTKIKATQKVVQSALRTLTDSELEKEYPILVFTEKTSTGYLLVHLTTHLTYHLGQINYHRRLLDE